MKNKIIITAVLAFFTMNIFAQEKMAVEQKLSQEEMAVKKVIENETMYFFQRNYDKWAECVAHDPMTYYTWISPFQGKDGIWEAKGWKEVSKGAKQFMESNSADQDIPTKSNYHFKINGDMAFVTFIEGKENEGSRVLEKKKGQWQILRMEAIASKAFVNKHKLYSLHRFAGTWDVDISTLKKEGGGTWKLEGGTMNIERTSTGIVSTETYYYKDEQGEPRTGETAMVYSLDMGTGKIGVFSSHYYPYSSWSTSSMATADVNDQGALVGEGTKVGGKKINSWVMKLDGNNISWSTSTKDKDGKVVYKSSYSYQNANAITANKGVKP